MKRKKTSQASIDLHTYAVIDLQSLSDRTLIGIVLDHSSSNEHDHEIFKVLVDRKLMRGKPNDCVWTAKGQRIVETLEAKTDLTASPGNNKEAMPVEQAKTWQSRCSNLPDRLLVYWFCAVEMRTDMVIQLMEYRRLAKFKGEEIVLTDAGNVILKALLETGKLEEVKEVPEEKKGA